MSSVPGVSRTPRGQASASLLTKNWKNCHAAGHGRAASAADLPEHERWCRAEASPPGGKTGGVEYNFSGPRLS